MNRFARDLGQEVKQAAGERNHAEMLMIRREAVHKQTDEGAENGDGRDERHPRSVSRTHVTEVRPQFLSLGKCDVALLNRMLDMHFSFFHPLPVTHVTDGMKSGSLVEAAKLSVGDSRSLSRVAWETFRVTTSAESPR